ncbi:amino acid adenylation domain-containing protein [Variovorax sp. TBS-050B]|uniref:amino acid adenylation domain-containing protein n=1 Tax=Variovorax sp. TBS-050B TaxID=2940551 RepID=UPI002476BAB6|nr:amino acid adenylation domain-containing protein [Variovorax sp. TBS-050B]MDH6593496.1 amino acid adenylation domain-containing protein [Variovorax sp. TBS-050B]
MSEMSPLSERRAKLSPAQLSLLQSRLKRDAGGAPPAARDTIARMPVDGPAPVSFAQQGQWFLWQLDPGNTAYHIGGALGFSGPLDAAALHDAMQALARRHEALRTVFGPGPDGLPVQRVLAEVRIDMPFLDLSALDAGARASRYREAALQSCRAPFDLTTGPLLRCTLLKMSEGEHQLLLMMHHIVSDAWSVECMLDELAQGYAMRLQGAAIALPAPEIGYVDFSRWQRRWLAEGEGERQLAWWRRRLGGSQPVLALATDRPRPAEARYSAAQHALEVPAELAQALRQRARAQGGTLFMVLLAAFHGLLFRHTGQPAIRVGVPVAGRGRPETAGVVGAFINTLVLDARLDAQTCLADLLAQVRDTAIEAQAHQDLPFECLVQALRADQGHGAAPLFQVMFNHLGPGDRPLRGWPGLRVRRIDLAERAAPFELTLETIEREDGGIQANFRYAAELFEADTVARMAGHYRRLLEAMAHAPEGRLGAVELLADAERAQLAQWGVNTHRRGDAQLVHRLIERQAAELPEATALVFGSEALSYGELNRRANRLAHRLIAEGVRPETRVGVALERSIALVVGLLAILKAGGAYVPLDPEYPAERIACMIEDSALALVLTQEHLKDRLPAGAAFPRVLALDGLDLSASAAHDPGVPVHAENLAYVIFTSGSTGRPKGAANRHGALYNRLVWMQQAYALGEADTVLQKTPFSFDVSVWEFFWPLMFGARLAVAQPGDHREPARLVQAIRAHAVSTLHFVPSMLQAFLAHPGVEACTGLRRIVCSGEALPAEVQNEVFRRLPQVALHNLYGPTEAAIDVTHWTCRDDGRAQVPIGRPIDDTRVHVLDAALNLLPAGAAGELYLGGAGLARGYAQRPGLSAERFVADPFDTEGGGRLYRTGDLVRWNAEGQLEYLGRIDHQVKIRGFRIELGEVEARLLAEPEVREAVVVARQDAGGARLAAYVSPHAGRAIDTARLRECLGRALPEYMVPAFIVVLDSLPLNPNGKVDRQALPEPGPAGAAAWEPPQPGTEEALAAIWAEVLGVPRVGRHDHFFALGGHSLMSVQVVARVQAALHAELTVADVFRQPVLKDMAARVADAAAGKAVGRSLADIDDFMNSLEETA